MNEQGVKQLQRELNAWTKKWLTGVDPLKVDGELGRRTKARIMGVKWYLGYGKHRDADLTIEFARRRRHPRDLRFSTAKMIATGVARRRRHKRRARILPRRASDSLWGGSRYFTNEAIEICARHGLPISRRKWSGPPINGNWGSDHNVWNTTADAVDNPTYSGQDEAEEIAHHLGGSYQPGSWNNSYVESPRNGKRYRLQILWHAPDGSHTDHVHTGARVA